MFTHSLGFPYTFRTVSFAEEEFFGLKKPVHPLVPFDACAPAKKLLPGALGWLRALSVRLLISTSRSQGREIEPHIRLCDVELA